MKFKFILVFISFIMMSFSLSFSNNTTSIRKSFFELKGDLVKAEKLYNNGLKIENKSAVLIAYIGVLKSMLAGNRSNPITKLSWFNKGTAVIEKAIKKDSNNPEIHFLRLTIQLNAPSFLFYYGDIDEDKAFVIENMNYFKTLGIEEEVKLFLKKNAELSEEELNKINS